MKKQTYDLIWHYFPLHRFKNDLLVVTLHAPMCSARMRANALNHNNICLTSQKFLNDRTNRNEMRCQAQEYNNEGNLLDASFFNHIHCEYDDIIMSLVRSRLINEFRNTPIQVLDIVSNDPNVDKLKKGEIEFESIGEIGTVHRIWKNIIFDLGIFHERKI
jgi:hypothetical protein